MDPDFERRLTEEVLYLHSLCRRRPPRKRNPKPKPPATAEIPNPSASISGKKRRRKPRNRNKKKSRSDAMQDPGPEWPALEPVIPEPAPSGWPVFKPKAAPAVQPTSPEELAELAALRLQNKEFSAFREFLKRNADSDSDEEENDDESKDIEEYSFFLEFFVENSDLRDYYQKNSESGSFCCLVCGGIGKRNSGKRFKNCYGLVQHSITISEKRRAHRAFGKAICKVLGWDFSRLPTLILKGGPLGGSLADSGNSKIENAASLNADNSQKNEDGNGDKDKDEGDEDENSKNAVDGNEDGDDDGDDDEDEDEDDDEDEDEDSKNAVDGIEDGDGDEDEDDDSKNAVNGIEDGDGDEDENSDSENALEEDSKNAIDGNEDENSKNAIDGNKDEDDNSKNAVDGNDGLEERAIEKS